MRIILHILRKYEIPNSDEIYLNFHKVLKNNIFEKEKFDEYMGIDEYLLLRDITVELKRYVVSEGI